MSFLEQLMGGGQQRDEYQDFVRRYDQGNPWDGVSDQEAVDRYGQVTRHLSPQDYEVAAHDTFERLTPDQRLEFGRYLRQQAQQQQVNVPDLNQDGIDDRLQDPRELARITSRMQQEQPGMLEQLLGGMTGGGGGRSSMGGMGDMVGGASNMLGNPLAKAALAGIAAMAAQRMMGGNRGR